MRIVVIGERLHSSLFEIIRFAENINCSCVFFKELSEQNLCNDDLLIIDCQLTSAIIHKIKNKIISVATIPNYKKHFENEVIISRSSLKNADSIIKKILEKDNYSDAAMLDNNIPIAEDQISLNILRIARKIAPTNATVLISGETGTGKEVLAQYIHRMSKRNAKKFVAINCAAIPDTLLESELFGHEKGAFTNAYQRRIGKFEEANQGTILLDEISEMSMFLQAKLLRVIQEREFSRLGSNEKVKIDVRIIATSNKNLRQAVLNGTFREDLLYRLNIIPIEIPALRNRKKDIVPLAKFFCKKYSASQKKLSANFLNYLLDNEEWRGNVRELENFIYRSVILSEKETIDIGDVININNDVNGIFLSSSSNIVCDHLRIAPQKTLAQIEKTAIFDALEKCKWNKTLVSKQLGISLRTLNYKLSEYNKENGQIIDLKKMLT